MVGCMVRDTGKSACEFCGGWPPRKRPGPVASAITVIPWNEAGYFLSNLLMF